MGFALFWLRFLLDFEVEKNEFFLLFSDIPVETLEGVIVGWLLVPLVVSAVVGLAVRAFGLLLRRQFLQVVEAAHTYFPQLDVEIDEHDEHDARKQAVVEPHSLGHHQQGVEGAVEQHREEESLEAVFATAFGLKFGQGEIVAHHHAEEEMARHGQHGAHSAGHNGRIEGGLREDVHHIFEAGKAERDEGGVDDAVEIFVEFARTPHRPRQQHQFAQLFAASGHNIAVVKARAEARQVVAAQIDIEVRQDGFEEYGRQCRQAAEQEGLDEHPQGFFFEPVLPVDEESQHYDRQDGKG